MTDEQSTQTDEDEGTAFETTDEEFRALHAGIEKQQTDLMQLANRMAQRTPDAADVLRQVVGNVMETLKDVVDCCGGAFAAIEEQMEDSDLTGGGEGIGEEDAVNFYRTIMGNMTLVKAAVDSAPTVGEERTGLDALLKMNEEMLERIVDLSEFERDDLERMSKETVPETPEEAAPPAEAVN